MAKIFIRILINSFRALLYMRDSFYLLSQFHERTLISNVDEECDNPPDMLYCQ